MYYITLHLVVVTLHSSLSLTCNILHYIWFLQGNNPSLFVHGKSYITFSYRVTNPVWSTLRSPTSLSLTTWPSSGLGWSFPSCRSFPEIWILSRHPMVWWWMLSSESASPRRSGPRLQESWTLWGGWRSPCVAWTYRQVNRYTVLCQKWRWFSKCSFYFI